jgi:hypothetical protein
MLKGKSTALVTTTIGSVAATALLLMMVAPSIMPTATTSAFAAPPAKTKDLMIIVVDAETGDRVAGECNVFTDIGAFSFIETNAGGIARVTLGADATSADIACGTGAGFGSTEGVTLKPTGTTRATVEV